MADRGRVVSERHVIWGHRERWVSVVTQAKTRVWTVGVGLTSVARGCPPNQKPVPSPETCSQVGVCCRPHSALSPQERPCAPSHWALSRTWVLAADQKGRPPLPQMMEPVLRKGNCSLSWECRRGQS